MRTEREPKTLDGAPEDISLDGLKKAQSGKSGGQSVGEPWVSSRVTGRLCLGGGIQSADLEQPLIRSHVDDGLQRLEMLQRYASSKRCGREFADGWVFRQLPHHLLEEGDFAAP